MAATTSRVRHDVRVGRFTVDAFPGMHTALRRRAVTVEINATLSDGQADNAFVVAVPDLIGAIISGRSRSTERRRLVAQVVPFDPRPDPFANP